MALIGYSPWQDAAQVGQGLGQALVKALIEVPRLKAREAMDQRELDLREREVGAREGMYKEHARLYGEQAVQLPLVTKIKEQLAQADVDRKLAQQELYGAQAARQLAEMERVNQLTQLMPEEFSVRNATRQAQGDFYRTRTELMPGEYASRQGLRQTQQNALLDPTKDLMRIIGPELVFGQGDAALPNAMAAFEELRQKYARGGAPQPPTFGSTLAPVDSGSWRTTDAPPAKTRLIRVRDRRTGRTGWATPDEAQNPNLEVLEGGQG